MSYHDVLRSLSSGMIVTFNQVAVGSMETPELRVVGVSEDDGTVRVELEGSDGEMYAVYSEGKESDDEMYIEKIEEYVNDFYDSLITVEIVGSS